MRNKTNLDERQLWQRGNVFKHGFVFLLAALAAQGSARPAASPGPRAPGRRSCSFGAAWPCAGGSSYSGNLSRGEEPEGVLLRHGPVWGVHRGDGAGLLGGRARPVAGGGGAHICGGYHPHWLPDGLHPGGAPGENRLGQAPSPRGRGVILQLPPRRLAEILANPGKSGIIEGYF